MLLGAIGETQAEVEVKHGIQVGGTDEFETCFGVQGHRLPISGVGWWDTTSQLSTACSQTEAVNT
jgi:hypothetical protein